jgi:hypothetical protein
MLFVLIPSGSLARRLNPRVPHEEEWRIRHSTQLHFGPLAYFHFIPGCEAVNPESGLSRLLNAHRLCTTVTTLKLQYERFYGVHFFSHEGLDDFLRQGAHSAIPCSNCFPPKSGLSRSETVVRWSRFHPLPPFHFFVVAGLSAQCRLVDPASSLLVGHPLYG